MTFIRIKTEYKIIATENAITQAAIILQVNKSRPIGGLELVSNLKLYIKQLYNNYRVSNRIILNIEELTPR